MLGQSITRNSVLLALFAVCTTLLIAGTYLLTKDDIALQIRQAEERALLQIVPRSRHDNSMLDDTLPVGPQSVVLGLRQDKRIYVAREVFDVFCERLVARASGLRAGYGFDSDVFMGPMVSDAHRRRFRTYLDDLSARGHTRSKSALAASASAIFPWARRALARTAWMSRVMVMISSRASSGSSAISATWSWGAISTCPPV